jgi:hypothetical protein
MATSHGVVAVAGDAGKATVTEPTETSLTDWVITSCSV